MLDGGHDGDLVCAPLYVQVGRYIGLRRPLNKFARLEDTARSHLCLL